MKMQILISLAFVAILQSTFAAVTTKYEDVFEEFPGEVFTPIKKETSNYQGENYDAVRGNANKYLDDLLGEAKTTFRANNIDPMSIPNFENSFSNQVWFVTFHGGFQAYNIYLNGLSTLHRAGDATLDSSNSAYTKITATLAVNNMVVGSDARAWFMAINIPWHMSSTIEYLKCTIEVHIPSQPGAKPRAVRLEVNEVGNLYVNFKNLGPLNWILNGVGFLFTGMLKGIVRNDMPGHILNVINSAIPNLPSLGL